MTPHAFLVPVIAMAIATYASAFKKGKPVCDRYTLNTYMYAVTYLFMLTWFTAWVMQYPKLLEKMDLIKLIVIFVVYIAAYFAVMLIPKDQALLKHMASVLYIAVSGVLLASVFIYFQTKSIMTAVLMSVVLFVVLTLFVFKFPEKISSHVSWVFFMVFLVMIIAEFIVGMFYPSSMLEKGIILVVLMLICYLVLVKTKRIIENEASCLQDKGPDYPKESIGLVLSFQNILLRILAVFGKRRLR
jgi:FtsH-binding integral membrane protein